MSDKIPADYRDYPTAYVGQVKKHPAEEYGDFPDRSKNDAPAGRQDANDALDVDKPAGMSTTPVEQKKKNIVKPATAH